MTSLKSNKNKKNGSILRSAESDMLSTKRNMLSGGRDDSSIKITEIVPKCPVGFEDLGSKYMPPLNDRAPKFHQCEFIVDDVAAFANALRRIIIMELPVYATIGEFETDDEFILVEMLSARLLDIPIDQKKAADLKTEAIIKNNTFELGYVYTTDIPQLPATRQFFCELRAGKYLKITNIRTKLAKGNEHAAHTVAHSAVSIPVDISVVNNKSISTSNVRGYIIKFETNGTMHPTDIIKQSFQQLITRLENLREWKKHIVAASELSISAKNTGNQIYNVMINDETHTVGNIIKTIMLEQGATATYNIDTNERLAIKFVSNDPHKLFDVSIDIALERVRAIQKKLGVSK